MSSRLLKSERVQARGPRLPGLPPSTAGEYRATAKGLWRLAAYLNDLSEERKFCELLPAEVRLAEKAEDWSARVFQVVAEIREAVVE